MKLKLHAKILQSDSFENCEISNWYMYLTLACVIFPILLVLSVHRFKVELYLLYRKFMNCQETQKQSYDSDIYICSGESSLELRKWLKSVFVPFFEGRRYRVIWPERDFLPGSMISEEVTTSVTKSANYVVFLSYAFCASHESEDSKMKMEWRQIWNSYKEGNKKKVLLVIILITSDVQNATTESSEHFCTYTSALGLRNQFCWTFRKRLDLRCALEE